MKTAKRKCVVQKQSFSRLSKFMKKCFRHFSNRFYVTKYLIKKEPTSKKKNVIHQYCSTLCFIGEEQCSNLQYHIIHPAIFGNLQKTFSACSTFVVAYTHYGRVKNIFWEIKKSVILKILANDLKLEKLVLGGCSHFPAGYPP